MQSSFKDAAVFPLPGSNGYNLEVNKLISSFDEIRGKTYGTGIAVDDFLKQICMKRRKAEGTSGYAQVPEAEFNLWVNETPIDLAIFLELKDGNLFVEKFGNEQVPQKIAFFLIEVSSTSTKTLYILDFVRAIRASPLHLTESSLVLRQDTRFKCTRKNECGVDYDFSARLADNENYPHKSQMLIHDIDIERAALDRISRKEFITWMNDVKGTVRFRELKASNGETVGIQVAFAISTFEAVSYWANAKYPLSGAEGDLLKCYLQNPDTRPAKMRGDGNTSIYIEIKDPVSGERDDFEWMHLRYCFERAKEWISVGPGSRRFRQLKIESKPGGDWRGLSLEKEAAQIATMPTAMMIGDEPHGDHHAKRAFSDPSRKQSPGNMANVKRGAALLLPNDLPELGYLDPDSHAERSPEAKMSGQTGQRDKSHDFQRTCGDADASFGLERHECTVPRLTMRGQGGKEMMGKVVLHFPQATAAGWMAKGCTVRSLCTVMAGRDAANVFVPAAREGDDLVVLLIVSASQWNSEGAAGKYLSALAGADGLCRGIAVADDNLLPARGGNVAHRRLLALRLAMLLRVAALGGPVPRIEWKQWVQADDNIHHVVDNRCRPMSFARMLQEIGSWVRKYPAVTVAEVDHRKKARFTWVDKEKCKTGSGKLTVVAWELLEDIQRSYGDESLDLLFPCAPHLEDYYFQLMLMLLSLKRKLTAGRMTFRPRRYFGLVRSRVDSHRAKDALQEEGWTDDKWRETEVLRCKDSEGGSISSPQPMLECCQAVLSGDGSRN